MRGPPDKLLTLTLSNKLLRTRDRAFNQRRKNHKKGRSTFLLACTKKAEQPDFRERWTTKTLSDSARGIGSYKRQGYPVHQERFMIRNYNCLRFVCRLQITEEEKKGGIVLTSGNDVPPRSLFPASNFQRQKTELISQIRKIHETNSWPFPRRKVQKKESTA